jgi:hypothetical protein
MPRISVSLSMLPAIGKVVGEASIDPAKRAAFKADPAGALRDAGVPESSLQGLDLKVCEDKEAVVHLVVPFEADADKIDAGDKTYLELLGTVAVMGCVRELI